MKRLCLSLLLVTACTEPAPSPERQQAEYTIKTAAPKLGSLRFALDGTGRVSGTLDLDTSLATTHPVRVGLVWLQAQFTVFANHDWQSVAVQEAQDSVVVGTAAGANAYSLFLPAPPASAVGGVSPRATLVAFIDVNENGVLDVTSSAPLIDHVLAASDFRAIRLGHYGRSMTLSATLVTTDSIPVFDDPLLDVVACAQENRFAVERSCGVPVFVTPFVSFFAQLQDDRVELISVTEQADNSVSIDGAPFTADDFARVATGQHLLRVLGPNGGVFEATFTLPEPTEVRAIRSAGFSDQGEPQFDVELKKLTGAEAYTIVSRPNQPATIDLSGGTSPTPTVRAVGIDTRNFTVGVTFPLGLPFRVNGIYARGAP